MCSSDLLANDGAEEAHQRIELGILSHTVIGELQKVANFQKELHIFEASRGDGTEKLDQKLGLLHERKYFGGQRILPGNIWEHCSLTNRQFRFHFSHLGKFTFPFRFSEEKADQVLVQEIWSIDIYCRAP